MILTINCIKCGGEKIQRKKEGKHAFMVRKFCSISCGLKYNIEKGLHKTPFVKGHKVRVGLKHPLSFIIKRRGEGNPAWKGDSCGVHSLHSWIIDNFGQPDNCETCGKQRLGRSFDWSNKDHKYSRKKEDWQFLCRSCHAKYDIKMGLRKYKKHI